jgi:hypothetical protein
MPIGNDEGPAESLFYSVGPCVGDDTGTISDIRLKEDITQLTCLDNGIGLYRYCYKWSDQLYVGVMAQEVASIVPSAVLGGKDGYLRVDYRQLGMRLMKWEEWPPSDSEGEPGLL